MANNYISFSEGLQLESVEELKWIREQMEDASIAVLFEPGENDTRPRWLPLEKNGIVPPGYVDELVPRFLCRDDTDFNDCTSGFECTVHEADLQIIFYTDECGDPGRVTMLVQEYLKQFHPGSFWHMAWAETCSRPKIGEFGGGAVFVMANEIRWMSACDWIEEQVKEFERHDFASRNVET